MTACAITVTNRDYFVTRPLAIRSTLSQKTGMQSVSIFEFTRFSDFFATYCRTQKRYDGTFSYQRLARQMGLRSPSLLAMIASGKRVPTDGCLLKLSSALGLTGNEREYASALVGGERSRTEEEQTHHARRAASLRPKRIAVRTRVDLDSFDLISRWHHLAILEMTDLADFCPDPHWIARRLGGAIGVREAKEAMDRLLRLGLIKDEGGVITKTSAGLEMLQGVPSRAIRGFHRQHLDNAKSALEAQTLRERVFMGHTISMDPAHLPEVQQLFQQFLKDVDGLVDSGSKLETYHLAFQCFRLTEKRKAV